MTTERRYDVNTQHNGDRSHEWLAYYDAFEYFSRDTVRDGCHPRIMEHETAERAVVLVHGLTDSPHFLAAIGEHFHGALGYNVYMPLLHCHGLKHPNGMEGVKLEEWKRNVQFAIWTAAERSAQVSIGGLSTGGTLSFYMACTEPRIGGDLYLFSAALDLAGGPFGLIGELKERVLRTFLADLFDRNAPLIGRNPYRYARLDLDGAQELARLIKQTDALLKGFDRKTPFPKRVFAAHSESDTTANIQGIRTLKRKTSPHDFTAYVVPKSVGVPHASLVLKEPVFASDAPEDEAPLEAANPEFDEMMAALTAFAGVGREARP